MNVLGGDQLLGAPGGPPDPTPYVDPSMEVSMLERPSFMPREDYVMPEETPTGGTPAEPVQDPVDAPEGDPMLPKPMNEVPPAEAGRRPLRVGLSPPAFNQNYRYTNEDFYGQRDHRFTFTDPRGVQLELPRSGELPLAIMASQMQEVQRRREDLRKQIATAKGDMEVTPTAPPYQQSFARLVTTAQNSLFTGVAEQYGGNEGKAWEEIATPGTAANRQWMAVHQDLEAISQQGKFLWGDAKTMVESPEDYSPEAVKMAQEYYYGLGDLRGDEGVGEIRALLKKGQALQRTMSKAKFVKEFVIPNIKDRYARHDQERLYRNKGTNQNVAERTRAFDAKPYLRSVAKDWSRMYGGTEEENYQELIKAVPPEHMELDVKTSNVPQPKSGKGKSAGNTGAGTQVRADIRRVPNYNTGTGKTTLGDESVHLTPFEETGGKEKPVREMSVSDGSTTQRSMRDVSLAYAPNRGEWRIAGNMLDEGGQKKLAALENGEEFAIPEDATPEESLAITEKKSRAIEEVWKKYLKSGSVPASRNNSLIETYWEPSGDPNAAVAKIIQQKGGSMSTEEVATAMKTKEGRERVFALLEPGRRTATPASEPVKKATKGKLYRYGNR